MNSPAPTTETESYLPEELRGVREHHRQRLSGIDNNVPDATRTEGSAWKGLGLGLFGVVILSIVTPYADGYLEASGLAATYLPTGVFLMFLLLLGLNSLLLVIGRPLTQKEIMLAYMTMLVPSAIPTAGFALKTVGVLVEVYHYADPINEWAILHHGHIPQWMTPHGEKVIEWFFVGLPEGESIPWMAWVKPLLAWCLMALGLYLMMTAISIVLRKRWMDAERLQFPLAQIPLTVMGDDEKPSWNSSFFRQPMLWVGIAIPLFFHTMNGLHLYFPSIPAIKLTELRLETLVAGSQIVDPPFERLKEVTINFYWSIIGISYLLRSEVSLSVWVFEWFYIIEMVLFDAVGIGRGLHAWSPLHTFGSDLSSRYQKVGGMILAAVFFFWASRTEIREMISTAFGSHHRKGTDSTIPWWTMWAFLLGLTIYVSWIAATGMKIIAGIIMLFSFLVVGVVTARVVAATGLLWVYDYYVHMHGLAKVMGTARLDPHTFTNVGFVSFAALNHRANLMPMQLDSMKIAQQRGIQQKHFLLGMALGIPLAMFVGLVMVLWMAYTFGAATLEEHMFKGGGNWLFGRVGGFQMHRVFTDWTVVGIMGAGAGFMSFLFWMHRNFLWWGINPLGFILGNTVASGQMWFSVFLGWLIKSLVLRFGQADGYNRLKSTALGMVIGEFVCVGIWLAIDALAGMTGHKVFPIWTPR
jgi:hypothetical protein